MNRWGIGTKLFRYSLLYGALAAFYDELFLAALGLATALRLEATPLALGLLACGAAIYAAAIPRVYDSIDRGLLETRGVYAVFRHPIYAAWTLFLAPGLALLKGTPLVLTLPAVNALFYRLLAPEEERHLLRRHGEDYRLYMARVGGIVPRWPLRRRGLGCS